MGADVIEELFLEGLDAGLLTGGGVAAVELGVGSGGGLGLEQLHHLVQVAVEVLEFEHSLNFGALGGVVGAAARGSGRTAEEKGKTPHGRHPG